MNMVNLLDSALGQQLDVAALSPEFAARIEKDAYKEHAEDLIPSIKEESKARVNVYMGKPGVWFGDNAHLGKAVADCLALPALAMQKFWLWLHDSELDVIDAARLNFQTARLRAMKRRARLLTQAQAAGDKDAVAVLALEDCGARHGILDASSLEQPDEISGETPLITHCFLDDLAAATRLLLARANPNAVTQMGKVCLGSSPPPPCSAHMQMRGLGSHAHKRKQEHAGMTALLYAAQEGHADIAKLLLDFKAYPDILHPTVPQAACLWRNKRFLSCLVSEQTYLRNIHIYAQISVYRADFRLPVCGKKGPCCRVLYLFGWPFLSCGVCGLPLVSCRVSLNLSIVPTSGLHTQKWTNLCIYIFIYMCIYTYIYVCVWMYVSPYLSGLAHTKTQKRTYHMHIFKYNYEYACARIFMYVFN